MLSYKLKHLCSRVIASLSAVGLISITNTGKAHAKNYEPSATVTNTYVADTAFTATYSKTLTCQTSTDDARIVEGFTGMNGYGQEICTYILKPGYALIVETGNCLSRSSDFPTYYEKEAGTKGFCTEESYSGVYQNTYSGTTVEGLLEPSDEQKGGYAWTAVQARYESGGIDPSQAVVSVPASADKTAPLPSVVNPKQIRIDFACGDGTYVEGTTGVAYVIYGTDFVTPGIETCTPPSGTEFEKWSD